jgi:cation diffusion facilitator CzcD-associated flavoprotein CzcO
LASQNHFDVLIVGGGLSGIGAAHRLQQNCPRRSFAILEARGCIGGTWDLFRYPGVRSDSDMFTLGYSFRPWSAARAIADGGVILQYIRDTAAEFGIDAKIRFNHAVKCASWSSPEAIWNLDVERGSESVPVRFTCNFLFVCTGYYSYTEGYTPIFPGRERFTGQILHPQEWPQNFDYAGKRIVVIGSGATAVTLVPELARAAAQVTMLLGPLEDGVMRFLGATARSH